MKKIVRLLLTLSLVMGIACTSLACGEEKADTKPAYEKLNFEGIHQMDATDIEGKYLVKDNKTDYVIVMKPNATSYVDDAKNELRLLFERATGCLLDVVYSDEISEYTNTAKYICLGENAFSESAFEAESFSYDKDELGREGIRIKTLGESIFILPGTSDMGVLYGVYDFLQIYFGFDHYYRNANELLVTDEDILLKDFDVRDVPDFLNRTGLSANAAKGHNIRKYELDNGLVQQDMTHAIDRFRLIRNGDHDLLLPIPFTFEDTGPQSNIMTQIHNTDAFVSEQDERYGGDRFDERWISDNGGSQLCLTGHGDEEAVESLVEHMSKKILLSMSWYNLKDNPTLNYVSITGEDNYQNCTCETCMEEYYADNSSYCGTYIRFCERVAARVKEMLRELPEGDQRKERIDTFKVVNFAYGFTKKSPTKYDDKLGKHILADGRERMSDDVVMYVCNGYSDNLYDEISYAEDGKATGFYADQGGAAGVPVWSDITSELWLWDYGKYFGNPIFMCDVYGSFNNDKFEYLACKNFSYYYCQVDFHSSEQTSFEGLKEYLNSQLLWDSNRVTGELIDKYFKGMYGVAADIMQEAFDTERLRMNIVTKTNDFGNSLSYTNQWTKKAYWHYAAMLKPQLAFFDRALEAIEVYKYTDPQRYELIKSRILIEKIGPLYKIFNAYGDSVIFPFNAEERINMLNEGLYVCNYYTTGVQYTTYKSVLQVFEQFK